MMSLRGIQVFHQERLLLKEAREATSLFSKIKGLLGTSELREGEGLLIPGCKQVHTYFMKYPIDVIFLDEGHVVLKRQTLDPWRVSSWVYQSHSVLEVPAGFSEKNNVREGEKLEVRSNDTA